MARKREALTATDYHPGPWSWEWVGTDTIRIADAEDETVARLHAAHGVKAQHDVAEAVAPLLSAAPDLLAACEEFYAVAEYIRDVGCECDDEDRAPGGIGCPPCQARRVIAIADAALEKAGVQP